MDDWECFFLIESDRVLPIPRPSRYRVKTLTDENHEWEQSGGMGLASEGLVGVGGIGVGWVIGNDWHCQAPPFTQFNSCWNAWLTFTASTSTCALHLISLIFFTVSQLTYKKPIDLWIVKICFARADFARYCTMYLFLVGVIVATEVEAVWASFGLKRVVACSLSSPLWSRFLYKPCLSSMTLLHHCGFQLTTIVMHWRGQFCINALPPA